MNHVLDLNPVPFKAIKEGYKNIEMRLNDERRKNIAVGDTIIFINNETNEKMTCEVTNIYHYSSFVELYKHHPKNTIGYKENEEADPNDMLQYYTQEKIDKYGVLGIEIKII